MDNNVDSKNAYTKSDFSTQNNASANIGANAGNTSGTGDIGGIGSANNNFNNKNIYIKADFDTYNIETANADADASTSADDMSDTRDADSTGGADNNVNGKNAYRKADFNTYIVANANADTNAGDMSVMGKKISNNTNNIDIDQSNKVVRANKGGLGGTNKSRVGESNIKARVSLSRANKGGVGKANIEANKKAGVGIVANINNNVDGGNKVIH